MPRRKWPTVQEILRRAAVVVDRRLEETAFFRESRDPASKSIYVHRAMRPNLIKAVEGAGWTKTVGAETTQYVKP